MASRASAPASSVRKCSTPGARLNLSVAQLPFQNGERWVGLPPAAGAVIPPSKLSLVIHTIGTINPLFTTGLLVDEWVEVVPNTRETTALAFQFDMPDACAPQSVLIAVPPVPGQDWTAETLRRVLMETLDLAKLRAVDTESLGAARSTCPDSISRSTPKTTPSRPTSRRSHADRFATGFIMPQLFIDITFPTGVPTVDRTFQLRGNISWSVPSNWTNISKNVSVQFGPGGQLVAGAFTSGNNWQCTHCRQSLTPWGSFVQLTLSANASFRQGLLPAVFTLNVSTTFMVRLIPRLRPRSAWRRSHHRSWPRRCPVDFMFTGSATSSQAPIAVVQYKVEGGQFANAVNASGNWSQFNIRLPLPPTAGGPDHVLTIRAIDTFGTVGEISKSFAVHLSRQSSFRPAATRPSPARRPPRRSRAGRASSRSRTRGHRHQLQRSRVRPAVDADAPVADGGVPGRGCRHSRSGPRPRRPQHCAGDSRESCRNLPSHRRRFVAAQAYNPAQTPLEVLVERRRMRANDEKDAAC